MNLAGKIVKLAIDVENFKNFTKAKKGDVIGRVVMQCENECLVRLLLPYIGWATEHKDFYKLKLPCIGTYWYMKSYKLEPCENILMETE